MGHASTIFLLLLVLAGGAISQELERAQDVSSWQPADLRGKPIPLQEVTKERLALFVFSPGGDGATLCALRARLADVALQQAMERVVLVGGDPRQTAPCAVGQVALLRAPEGLKRNAGVTAFVVDDTLHVRWLQPLTDTAEGWAALADGVNTWLQGRQSFEANCGHCHGLDGVQASSPDVKPLKGITKKYPEAQVLDLGAQFGGVDMTGWNAAKRETLLTYIRGL